MPSHVDRDLRFVRWAGEAALIEFSSKNDGDFDIAVIRTIGGYQRAQWPCVWVPEVQP